MIDHARSTLFRPHRPKCPMCDNAGFKRVSDTFCGDPILRCHACGHEWESKYGRPDARGSDLRSRAST